jgi:hypothetical protein
MWRGCAHVDAAMREHRGVMSAARRVAATLD